MTDTQIALKKRITPGPWEQETCGGNQKKPIIRAINGPRRFGERYWTVCSFNKSRFNQADAHLVAAAPDLLEACEASHSAKTQAELDEAVRLIEQAIKKARGNSHGNDIQ